MCATAVWLASCTNVTEQDKTVKFSDIVITATQENHMSKTSVDGSDGKVFWNPEEAIKVFSGDASAKFVSQNTQKATSAVFICSPGQAIIGQPQSDIFGLYPYTADAAFSNGTFTTELADSQTAVEGTFADNLFISAGKASVSAPSITFLNVCAGLRFRVSEEGITSIRFKGNADETLAGKFSMTFDKSDCPKVSSVSEADDEIVLNCKGGFKKGVWYYIVTLPVQLTKGYTMTFESTSKPSQEKVLKDNTARELKRAVFGQKDNIDYGLEWKTKSGFIEIPDEVFRAFCISAFDADHDGGITPEEAAAVTVMNLKGLSGTVKSLKGIEYFVNLTDLTLTQCNLGTIDLSANTKLQNLNCASAGLTSLNVEANTALKTLNCSGNQLATLNLQKNLSLTSLICNNNPKLVEIWLKAGQTFDTLVYDSNIATIKYNVDDGGSEGVSFENW